LDPVLFGSGILAYFALLEEPRLLTAAALIMAAAGLILAGRGTGLGLIIGGAALALAAGFANAKLHTEMARAPVLAKEMRGVTVKGFVALYERRDKAKARITLRVISLGELPPIETPHRVRVTLSAANATVESGEAVSLRATLRPPPEPISPNGFDFGRKAWFDRRRATGYAIGKSCRLRTQASRHGICAPGLPSIISARSSRPASARAFPANAVRLPRR
jgi:competence protein ComEC